jgi:hydrogenase maturation factor HypE
VKAAVGEEIGEDAKEEMAQRIEICASQALKKREKFVEWIKSQEM